LEVVAEAPSKSSILPVRLDRVEVVVVRIAQALPALRVREMLAEMD
jgi:hypothetical protein